jgi:signal transduction histidine kinase
LLASGLALSDPVAMSLRTRLLLSYAALIVLLGLAAWWGLGRLTGDLTTALGETAASVGRSVFTVLRHESEVRIDAGDPDAPTTGSPASDPADGNGDARSREVIVLRGTVPPLAAGEPSGELGAPPIRMVVDGRELTPEEIASFRRVHARHPGLDLRTEMQAGRPALVLSGEGFARTIPLPRAGVDAALERYTRQVGWGLLALLGVGLLLSIWLAQRIARPLRALAETARSVGQGSLGAQAPDGGVPEVRETIAAFNRMSAQLQQLDAEATALRADRELAELGEIGRGLAHSLRNPLHALGLSLDALAAQAADPERAQSLAQAGREQLQRVDQALRGFLALSAGEGAEAASIPLREVIDDVLLEASQRARGRVRFVREGEELRLVAVAAELRVMLHALIINALEASPDGGVVTVRVRGDAPREGATIEVRDEGEGVPEAIRARLFQPHVSGKPHGAGMGLYLAQRLARLRYGGGIALDPDPPRGTCARLVLRPREARHG